MPAFDTAVLDIDGTLVDSNYQHAVAWATAFSQHNLRIPVWRIHRALGMGGDKLVSHVADDEVEEEAGDAVRATWKAEVDKVIADIEAFDEAGALLDDLRAAGLRVVLASSGKPDHVEHALDLLGGRDRVDHVTSSGDVDRSKPDPDLLEVAIQAVGGTAPLVIGDSVWDAQAAQRCGYPMIGVLAGGFGRDELERAGAMAVHDDVRSVRAHLREILSART